MGEIVSDTLSSSNGKSSRARLNPVWLFYALLALFLISVFSFIIFRPILVLPRISLAPGYALTDQDGSQLTNEDLRGKVVLYDITHTGCEEPCRKTGPVSQAVQARLDELLPSDIPVEFVTISIDPENDTPEVLHAYAESMDADFDQWHFVSGPLDRLKMIVGVGFNTYFDHKEDGRLVYNPGLMLVDGAGILRAEYITLDPDVDRIISDINLILEEVEKSEGANKVAYEAAHLFMCYP